MSIFYPTSTKKLSDLPTVLVDETNLETANVIMVHRDTGQLFKVPLSTIGQYLSASYESLLVNDETQIILGRYEAGPGSIQKIAIGDNITLNPETGLLDSNLEIVGPAGGVLEGEFPVPTLKPNSVKLSNFKDVSSGKILGRYDDKDGPPQEISLGPEFELNEETRVLSLISTANKVVNTGFIVETMEDGKNFVGVSNKIYFVNSELNITVDLSGLGNWKNGSQTIIINTGVGEVSIALPNGDFIAMREAGLEAIHIISDGNGSYFLL